MLDALVGTPFRRILDHLTLALGYEMGVEEGKEREVCRMLLICGAASWRE